MSHFAKIDSNNIVTESMVSEKYFINSGAVGDEFLWVQTSYNDNFRGKYASIGDTWDKLNEVFIPPRPYPSWSLDVTFKWHPPTVKPSGVTTPSNYYSWDEDTLSWINTPITT
tara:strand:- start:226 stop:564 length:339 start_codon:yes stop_codon:yes gene_type:complete